MSEVQLLKDVSELKRVTKEYLTGKYPKDSEVIVKIHFGEPGNERAFTPKDISPVIDAMKELELKAIMVDTPVVYNSPRNSVEGYGKVVRDKGYDKLAPFIISGEYEEYKTKDFTSQAAKELVDADNVLVISHVKGHICSGMGGAIKNFGMGGVSKETKDIQHTLGKPKWKNECQGCGICSMKCPADAIQMVDGKAVFDLDKCCGCSICTIVCPHDCLEPKIRIFDDLLAQAASSVINNLPENSHYINFIQNVCKKCDCDTHGGDIIAKDVGVLFSDNPVAIDKASVELVREKEGKDVFKLENNKDPMDHIQYTSEYSDFSDEYTMKEVD